MDWHHLRELKTWDEAALREALTADDPRLRVRAAWVLGLRLEGDFAATARRAIAAEPLPGVRRHWLIMLTGFGEVDIVAALARHDPDDDVRTTAARFVGELAVAHPDAYALVLQLLADERDGVRASVIDGLRVEPPGAVAMAIDDLRDDPSARVREAIGRWDVRSLDFAKLRQAALDDRDAVVRRAALRGLIETAGLSTALAYFPSELHQRLISDLSALGTSIPFDALAGMSPSPRWIGVMDMDSLGPGGRIWLLGVSPHQVPRYFDVVLRAYGDIAELTDPGERRCVADFLEKLRDSLTGPDDMVANIAPGTLTVRGAWSHWEAPRRRLIDALTPLL